MKNFYTLFLSFFVFAFSFAQPIKYKDSIALEIKSITSDSLKAQRFYKESTYALRRLNDLDLSRTYLDSSMYYSKLSGFKDSEAKCHFLYGLLERISGNYDIALEHLDKNIKYFEKDSTNKSYALFQIGSIKRNQGDYQGSLETFLEILKIFEHKKDSSAMASSYTSLANIYGDMGNNDEAIINYEKAVDIFVNNDDKRSQANTIRNISEIYLRQGDTIKSRSYANQSLTIAEELDEAYALGAAHYMLARTYLNKDDSQVLGNYLKAQDFLERINYKKTLIALYNDLGNFYKEKDNAVASNTYYNKTLKILENTEDLIQAKMTYKGLMENYANNDNFKKAFEYQSLYIQAKDSLFNEENIKSINLLQKQFETEKKNKEIVEQQFELQEQEAEIQKQETQIIFMTGIALFLLVAALLTWLMFQQKQKRKNQEILTLKREYQIKSLESLIEGEEKERFRIAKELHDGVNGDLSAIKYKLSSLLEMNNKVIKEAITMIDDSCEQVRAISHNLVPPSLENFNLVEATENYCNNLNVVNQETITFQHIGNSIHMSKKAEINAFRIIQELVSNALKHANANEINVQLSNRQGMVQITVEDDGKGFDINTIESQGIGLSNIKSRAEYLNAELDLISNDQGTSCTIDIDLNTLNDH